MDKQALRAAVAAVTPAGWRWTLKCTGNRVTMEIQAAPVDLLAEDARLNGTERRPYVKINPAVHEGHQLGAIWQALHSQNTVEFDANGDRAGAWYIVELWLGHWKRPFVVL